jgi:putative phage-type endonuclease
MEDDIKEFINTNKKLGANWTLTEWRDQLLETISHVYHKKDYHPLVIDQILCYNIPKLNNGRFIFKLNRDRDKKQLQKLLNIPKNSAQNSIEWHLKRHNHINASEASEVLGLSYKGILNKKVKPFISKQCSGLAAQLGHRYEPISVLIYESHHNKKVYQFESIEHPVYTFLAASPDGIDEDGIMKEIKNPSKREIIGVPKPEYWVQTQLQLECCDLNALDFIECSIKEYDCIEDYNDDIETKYKGCILEYWDNNEKCHRFYSNLNERIDEINTWKTYVVEKIHNDNSVNDPYINIVYWKLEKFSNFRVYRDREWFISVLPKFTHFWTEVLLYRNLGIPENMIIKKRIIKENEKSNEENVKCLIPDDDY